MSLRRAPRRRDHRRRQAPDAPAVSIEVGATPLVVALTQDGGVRAFVATVAGGPIGEPNAGSEGSWRDPSGSIRDLATGRRFAGGRADAVLEQLAVVRACWFAWSPLFSNTEAFESARSR